MTIFYGFKGNMQYPSSTRRRSWYEVRMLGHRQSWSSAKLLLSKGLSTITERKDGSSVEGDKVLASRQMPGVSTDASDNTYCAWILLPIRNGHSWHILSRHTAYLVCWWLELARLQTNFKSDKHGQGWCVQSYYAASILYWSYPLLASLASKNIIKRVTELQPLSLIYSW